MTLILSMILAYCILVAIYAPLPLWLSARMAGLQMGLHQMFLMRIRQIPLERIVSPLIEAYRAGIHVQLASMEAHYLAGGHPSLVINALIVAKANRIPLALDKAMALDLRGADLMHIARTGEFPAL